MHNYFMLAALEQAWLGRGICAPNPSVGAVAVHKGEIIAKAWHKGAGTLHAEKLVLEQIPTGTKDITLYVTLEPCNHWGRTPPCINAIIDHGIARVVYGFKDPNPLVTANNTPRLLQQADIDVIYHPHEQVTAFYQSYQYWTLTKKPWVTAKLAQSFDGKIAGFKGQRVNLSNNECAEFTHKQRWHSDVILTSAKTVQQDDPLLNARLNGFEQKKTLAIIDSRLSLTKTAKLFAHNKHCHIYYDEQYKINHPLPHCSYHPVPARAGLVELNAVIQHLGASGYHDVWVEAGGNLFSALHQAQLVQRSYFYIVPTILGSDALSAYANNDLFHKPHSISWLAKSNNVIACVDWQEDMCLPG